MQAQDPADVQLQASYVAVAPEPQVTDEEKRILDGMTEMIVDNLFTANNLHL